MACALLARCDGQPRTAFGRHNGDRTTNKLGTWCRVNKIVAGAVDRADKDCDHILTPEPPVKSKAGKRVKTWQGQTGAWGPARRPDSDSWVGADDSLVMRASRLRYLGVRLNLIYRSSHHTKR